MSAVGGSIESVTLDGQTFAVAADSEAQRNLGGFGNEVQANGNGTVRLIKSRKPWSITGLSIEVDDVRGDDEDLQALQNRKTVFPIAIQFASGVIYQGVGQIVGDNQTSSQSATKSIDLMGPGELTPQ